MNPQQNLFRGVGFISAIVPVCATIAIITRTTANIHEILCVNIRPPIAPTLNMKSQYGSKILAPKSDLAFSLIAKAPSNQSVANPTTKRINAIFQWLSNALSAINGATAIRLKERMFGIHFAIFFTDNLLYFGVLILFQKN